LFDSFKLADKVPGTGVLAGRVLQAVPTIASGANVTSAGSTNTNVGAGFFDITGPWRN
jgi:hypothetical protein